MLELPSRPTPLTGSNPSGTLMRTHIFYWLSIWLRQWSLSPGVEVEICPTFVATSRGSQLACLPAFLPVCPLAVFLEVLGQQIMPSICLLLFCLPLRSARLLSLSLCLPLPCSVYINWLVLLEKGLANAANACKRPQSQPSYEAVLQEFRQSKLLRTLSPSLSCSSLKQLEWACPAFSCDICSMSFKCLSTAYDNGAIWQRQMTALIDIVHIKGYWKIHTKLHSLLLQTKRQRKRERHCRKISINSWSCKLRNKLHCGWIYIITKQNINI